MSIIETLDTCEVFYSHSNVMSHYLVHLVPNRIIYTKSQRVTKKSIQR